MRNPASAFLLLLLAGSLASQTNEWKKYENTNGNFSVLFPDEPQDTINKTDSGTDSHTLLAGEKPASYIVV